MVKSCKILNTPVRCSTLKQKVSLQLADLQSVLLQYCPCLVIGTIMSLWVERSEFDALQIMPQGPSYMKH